MSEFEDRFRWCIYCGVDCFVDEPEHKDDCPSSTGVFPVREQDLICHGCKKTYLGMLCGKCSTPFKAGDSYTHIVEGGFGLVVCLGCSAKHELELTP